MAPRFLPELPGWFVAWLWVGEGGRMQFPPVVSWGHTPLPTLSARPFQAAHAAFREEAREMKKARRG